MKSQVFTFLLAGLVASSCSGQNIAANKVPSVVLNALKTIYPNATDVEWEKHQKFYEAELDNNDSIDVSVRIDDAGKVVMQKQDIPSVQAPSAITNAIQKKYAEFTIDDIARIEQNSKIYYQVELEGKSRKDIQLVLTENGDEEKGIKYWD